MIDLNELTVAIRNMSIQSVLYKTLKRELTLRGYWKNRARGKHDKGRMNTSLAGANECHIHGCRRQVTVKFYCKLHDIRPQDYGFTMRHKIPHYAVWAGMLSRCYNPRDRLYKHYGARGIGVCQEWQDSFNAYFRFVETLPRPKGGRLSIDRKDNDSDYAPNNCRWATPTMQARNRRQAVRTK